MSPTTQKFAWKDRDTAARDLLQLVYHAPEVISQRALELLQAIRSPAIVPELLDIFRNTNYLSRTREEALAAVALTPGDVYLPELRQYLSELPGVPSPFEYEILLLVKYHPSNQSWFLENLTSLPLPEQRRLSWIVFSAPDSNPRSFYFDQLIASATEHPELLDLHTVASLRFHDNRPSTLAWLAERWQTLIYLCLIVDLKSIPDLRETLVDLLEGWEELKTIVFASCPSYIAEYDAIKASVEQYHTPRFPPIDLNQSAFWCEMASYHAQAQAGDETSWLHLLHRTHVRDVLTKATAVHFLGQLLHYPDTLPRLLYLFTEGEKSYLSQDHWVWQDPNDLECYITHAPVRFEIGSALYTHPLPQIWESLVNAYFLHSTYNHFFIDWIAYQTDRLSGLDVEYTGATWELERRPWFRALVGSRQNNRLLELPILEQSRQ